MRSLALTAVVGLVTAFLIAPGRPWWYAVAVGLAAGALALASDLARRA